VARGFIKPEDQEPSIEGFEFYIDAYQELSTCRPAGMDLQPIPFTAIVDYSRIYNVGDFEEFNYIMRELDNTFLTLHHERQKKRDLEAKNASGNANKTHPDKR